MNWNDAKYLLAVGRAGQMLAAARRLGVSQATLNRRISALEADLQVKLFNRSTVGCELTPAGRDLFAVAMEAEAGFMGFANLHSAAEAEISGTVRLGAPDGFGVQFLAPHLPQFMARYPKLKLELVPAPQRFSLSQREADVAVMVGRPEKGRLKAQKLTDYALGLFAAKSYLAQRPAPESPAALDQHVLVGLVEDLIYTPDLNYAAEFTQNWQAQLEVSGALGLFQAVCAGAGIGVLHDFMTRDEPDLVPILPEHKLTRSYWTVWHEQMDASQPVRCVIAFLNAIVGENKALFMPTEKPA